MSGSDTTLFEKLGGDANITAMLQDFYQRVLSDHELAPFFATADVSKLIAMQKEFFAIGLDGPVNSSSRMIYASHHGRGITRHHFSRFCDHLLATLIARGLDPVDADKVLVRLSMYAGHVTGESGVDG